MAKVNLLPQLNRKDIEKLYKICEGNDIVFMAMFGSVVRGEAKRGSDLDIAIEFDERKPKSPFDLVHVESELSKLFKKEKLT